MTQLLGTGEVPIKSGVIHGPNAYPIPVTFVDERGVVTGVCIGGLTKRQELAARFLAATLSDSDGRTWRIGKLRDVLTQDECDAVVNEALTWADLLLKATEPKPL